MNALRGDSSDNDLSHGEGVNVRKRNEDGEALLKNHRQENHGGILIYHLLIGQQASSIQQDAVLPRKNFDLLAVGRI